MLYFPVRGSCSLLERAKESMAVFGPNIVQESSRAHGPEIMAPAFLSRDLAQTFDPKWGCKYRVVCTTNAGYPMNLLSVPGRVSLYIQDWQLPSTTLDMNISVLHSYAATILPLRVHADICGYPVGGSIIAFENVIYYWQQEQMRSRVEQYTL